MSKELEWLKEASILTRFEGRQSGKEIAQLMYCLKKQDEDNKDILYVGENIQVVIIPIKKYLKQEKLLEVIWNRKVDLWRLHFSKTLKDYNTYIMETVGFTLTQEEFDILKEWSNGKETNTD